MKDGHRNIGPHVANEGDAADRLTSTEIQAQLKETQEQLQVVRSSLAAIEATLERPGPIRRCLRNAFLLASNAPGGAKWKNIRFGLALLRNPQARAVWKEQFDRAWYGRTYVDVTRSGISPTLHYLIHGHLEGRAPSAGFDSGFYLRRHPDVRASGLNPLLHYALFGAHEKRTTAPAEVVINATTRVRHFQSQRLAADTAPPTPLVTVVIPCFNYGEHLAEAVRSVLDQTLPNVEVIVVEGGSTDGVTPNIVGQLEESGLPRTRFLYRSEPHLTGDNRNFGIREARTEYICCLDADDAIRPQYLEVAAFFAKTYGYDLVYPSAQAFGGHNLVWQLNDANAHTITEYNQVSTVAMFRKNAWEQVNGYRDFGRRTEYVAEDWEFWVRVLWAGSRAKCIPQPLHMYRVHNAGLWHGERSSVDYQRAKIIEVNCDLLACPPVVKPLSPCPNRWQTLLQPRFSAGAILLALPFVITGGAEKLFEMIIRSETAQGRKVIVITTLVLNDAIKDAADHFQTLTPYFYALPGLLGDDQAVWDDFVCYLIDQYSVDLIMIAGCDYMYHALPHLTKAFPKVGIVDQLFNQEVHFPTNRYYARFIDVTMVPSPAFATRMIEEFNEKRDRIAVIPHGVDIPVLDGDSLTDVRRRSGLPHEWNDCFIAGFFGRMSPEKAPADFVEIARRLKSEPNMRFVMTGEGPELERVRGLIHQYGLKDRIFGPGFVDNPRDLMTAVDVVVVPSILDGMPLVVMESQALGKVVLASSVGSIPVMIEDGRTGHLCRPGDVDGFSAKLRILSASPRQRTEVGLAAREFVAMHHSAEAMLQRYEEAFERARAKM
jgi:glycosyltransferase involved in cell wall biosynthesis